MQGHIRPKRLALHGAPRLAHLQDFRDQPAKLHSSQATRLSIIRLAHSLARTTGINKKHRYILKINNK